MLSNDDFVISALVEEGRLTSQGVETARRAAVERGTTVCEALVAQGALTTRDVALARAQTSKGSIIDLESHYHILDL